MHFIRSRTNSMTLITKKVLAASAAALMLLPVAASAHQGSDRGLHLGAFIGLGNLEHRVNATTTVRVGGGDRDNDGEFG